MTSCEPDGDIENRYYGIGSDQHKSKKKKKSTSTTPKADLVDDFDNHLENSPFAPSDVCPSCGYPRGSSVVCPVSLRHHGTDEVVKSHSRTPSGGMRLFHRLKHKSSKSTTPQEGVTPRSNDPTTPSAMLPPPCTGEGAVVLSANSTPACYEDEPEEGEEEEDGEGPPEEERAMQYYCYTDENGDTYYYAAEMEDTVPPLLDADPHRGGPPGGGGWDLRGGGDHLCLLLHR
ncbi:hypothetical protein ADEAN_000195800 [Angomonas deanei]|uniref:Uncharacterized protein n=1 Tax=Angomonas deanei TaxID=59799 RepID=A0A7G2C5U6_9TRYP|nr:hypothetical protein ADEAN_000195800 [Angomonas deanei]